MKFLMSLALFCLIPLSSFAQSSEGLNSFVGTYKSISNANRGAEIYKIFWNSNGVLVCTSYLVEYPSISGEIFSFDRLGAPAEKWKQSDHWSSFGSEYAVTTFQNYDSQKNSLVKTRIEKYLTFGVVPTGKTTSVWKFSLEKSGTIFRIKQYIDSSLVGGNFAVRID